MKRTIALIAAATMVFAAFSGPAMAGKKGKKKAVKQEYYGTIVLPAPYPADNTCFSRLERLIALYGLDQAAGMVGAHFDVNPKTAGQTFALHSLTDGADLDLIYYAGYGSETDPATAPAFVAFETREPGGEEGTVPAGMTNAIICMAAGQEGEYHYTTG
jgi:hypothetical protein